MEIEEKVKKLFDAIASYEGGDPHNRPPNDHEKVAFVERAMRELDLSFTTYIVEQEDV